MLRNYNEIDFFAARRIRETMSLYTCTYIKYYYNVIVVCPVDLFVKLIYIYIIQLFFVRCFLARVLNNNNARNEYIYTYIYAYAIWDF